MTTEEKIKYATWLSRVGLLESGAIRQSCVASVKLTTEVLRSLSIAARPITASVVAMTDSWVNRLEAGKRPTPEVLDEWWEEDRAWSVGVAYDPEPKEGSWVAHLILLAGSTQRYLVDPSLDQLARPERGLPVEPAMLDLAEEPHIDADQFRIGRTQAVSRWTDDEGGAPFWVIWSCFPHDRSFRNLNDFTLFQYRWGSIAQSVVNVIREMDNAGLTGDSLPPLPPLPEAISDPSLVARVRDSDEIGRMSLTAEGLRRKR